MKRGAEVAELSEGDVDYLKQAIELSREALDNTSFTPFGAIVVVNNRIVGQGVSEVVASNDPTAHAEVMALRHTGSNLATHMFPTATLYCSSEPCPLCLAACLWAKVPRIIFAASTKDVAFHGFEDLWFYREIALPREARSVQEIEASDPEKSEAVAILQTWAETVPGGVTPKL